MANNRNNKSLFDQRNYNNIKEYTEDEESTLSLYYQMLAMNLFKWENLPVGLESRHIEKALFENGQAFFFEGEFGLLCLPCSPSDNLNIYGEPLGVVAYGVGKTYTRKTHEGVMILNNDLKLPTRIFTTRYIRKISIAEGSAYANIKQQKFPYVVKTSKDNELTMKNVYKKLEDGEPCVVVDKELNENGIGEVGIETMQTNAPFVADKILQYKNDVENELLTLLGINNNDNKKKERLVVDEVNVNNGMIKFNLDTFYKQREDACKKINEMFHTNIKVSKVIEEYEEQEIEEVKEDI